VVTVYGLTVW